MRRHRQPHRFHADVRVVFTHLLGDVPGNFLNDEVRRMTALGQVANVCRSSCQRPDNPVAAFTPSHTGFRVVTAASLDGDGV
ncbi:MAG: hypothetical protein ABI972_11290 [Acidobacteriota bacterium]